ncbi:MAG: DUF1003 domain-containing protein [Acidobacteria bacterium]|nr:DUF1003 domain-containing protein [Acidobacteriota bacterium]
MAAKTVSQGDIIRKNTAAVTEMQRREEEGRVLSDRVSDAITRFSGSMTFVYFHIVWFGLWILLNVGLFTLPFVGEFDGFPFGLLTMVVSLEAIFLSTFVLISQNRMSRLAEKRAELDLHVNMLAEQKAAKTLEMLDHLNQQLDKMSRFTFTPDPEVEALKVSPEPGEVLQAIEEAGEDAAKVKRKLDDISGEFEEMKGGMRAVGGKVEEVDEKVEDVAEEVQEVKAKLDEITGEHEAARSK